MNNMFNEIRDIIEQYDRLKVEAWFRKMVSILFEVKPVGVVDYELFAITCDKDQIERIINTHNEKELIYVVKDIWEKDNKEWIRNTWKEFKHE